MKYRILHTEELQTLEPELKQFLIVNGIHAEQWEEINKNNPDLAINLVELFSDKVLQKVYEKIKFLEFRSKDNCIVFRVGDKTIDLISMQRKESSEIDFSSVNGIHEALSKHINKIDFFTSSKTLQQQRELEIHQMIQEGCTPSSEEFWNSLISLLNTSK